MNIMAIGVMSALTWGYAYTHRLMNSELSRCVAQHQGLRHLITSGVFLVSIGIAYLTPHADLAPWSLLALPLIAMLLDRLMPDKDSEPMLKERRGPALFWGLAPLILLFIFVAAGLLAFTTTQH